MTTKQDSTQKQDVVIRKRIKQGVVVSTSMEKTVVIVVHVYKRHPKYLKRYKISKKFHAHDPKEMCKMGDKIVIEETRPISKLKCWRVKEILN